MTTQSPITFCVLFISICLSLGLILGQCERMHRKSYRIPFDRQSSLKIASNVTHDDRSRCVSTCAMPPVPDHYLVYFSTKIPA